MFTFFVKHGKHLSHSCKIWFPYFPNLLLYYTIKKTKLVEKIVNKTC
jgi:hypothetical protein